MFQNEYEGKVSLKNKIARTIWNITYTLLFRPFPTNAFSKWRITVLRIFGAKVSYKANVYSSVKIWAPWKLVMEEGSCLGPYTICYNQATVTLRKHAIVSQHVYICTAGHDTTKAINETDGLIIAPVLIGQGAWIGTRAFIGMGVEIGDNAIIGATSSVFKDIEKMSIAGGNPAEFIKLRELK